MANRPHDERHVRSLTKSSGGRAYTITLPIEYVKQLKWQSRQKLEVVLKGKEIRIRDWQG